MLRWAQRRASQVLPIPPAPPIAEISIILGVDPAFLPVN